MARRINPQDVRDLRDSINPETITKQELNLTFKTEVELKPDMNWNDSKGPTVVILMLKLSVETEMQLQYDAKIQVTLYDPLARMILHEVEPELYHFKTGKNHFRLVKKFAEYKKVEKSRSSHLVLILRSTVYAYEVIEPYIVI